MKPRQTATPSSASNASASGSISCGRSRSATGSGVFSPSPVTSRTTRSFSPTWPFRTASRSAPSVTPEDEIVDNITLLAETTGVFGETAPAVTLGALRAAAAAGEIGESDRVVLLVTGDGLKTPGLVADRLDPIVVAPDAELILETLGGVR